MLLYMSLLIISFQSSYGKPCYSISFISARHIQWAQWFTYKFSTFDIIIPVNNVEGGYRNSQRPSVRKESPLTSTIFH